MDDSSSNSVFKDDSESEAAKRRKASEDVPTQPTQPEDRLKRLLNKDADKRSSPAGEPKQDDSQKPGPTAGRNPNPSNQWTANSEDAARRHPTGAPETTGGWFGELDATTPPPLTPYNEQTHASPVDPPSGGKNEAATQPNLHQPPFVPPERPTPPPSFDSGRTAFPRRVEERDPYATRVTPAAYNQRNPSQPFTNQGPAAPPPPNYAPPYAQQAGYPLPKASKKRAESGWDWVKSFGCVTRLVIGLVFAAIVAVIGLASIGVIQYFSIRATLSDVHGLQQHASQFETTRILDRNGDVLYEILDPNAGRRTFVPLKMISPYVVAATIATEDKEFYNHPGFDPIAILRALWQNYTSGQVVSGASTITQQLARALLLTPDERGQQSVERKAREIVLASEITRLYTKDQILELYLNENYFGNLAYGIEAASETYFNTQADKLTLGQAAFLAGLPQAPGIYDIYNNRDQTLKRDKEVLVLMYQDSKDNNCITVSNSPNKVCVDANAATQAANEIESYAFKPSQESMRFPHWVTYIRSLLEDQYDAQTIYRSGFTVYTTLDPTLQDKAQQIVKTRIDGLADHNIKDGALVAIVPSTGEIVAMVGSPDFNNDAISGQINMAISPRQPGSSIKILTYLAAFEKGWTPATLIWDVPTSFPPSGLPDDTAPPYVPNNYDGTFRGPLRLRYALANSINIPAVKTLNFVGLYNQDGFINFAKRFGISTLTRKDYGLSLTLGGGEVTPLELTSVYATVANGGVRMPPVAITKIIDYQGKVVYEYKPPKGEQVIRPEHAYLMTSILHDNQARSPIFGANSPLNLPFDTAGKTGTTNDFRDNWTLGYNPDLAVGVWVGNDDYTPMIHTTGISGAAPIWAEFLKFAVNQMTGGNPTPFTRPPGIVEKVICTVSGTEPSQWCPSQTTEVFAADQPPLPKEQDLWQKLKIDTWTGLSASPYCADYSTDKFAANVTDKSAINWLQNNADGQKWAKDNGFDTPIFFAPKRECKDSDPRPTILFAGLNDGQTIAGGPLDIYAAVSATSNFKDFRLEWGKGASPVDWKVLRNNVTTQFSQPDRIYTWDLSKVPNGVITLRIYMDSNKGTYAERRIKLTMQVPTPTPTPTITPTLTLEPSGTPLPTDTPVPVIPTDTSIPSDTPVPPTATP